jgi:hypothetical protein
MRRKSNRLFTISTGLFSCLLTLDGLAAVHGLDLRQNTVLSVFYCALPLLSLPLYFFALAVRKLLPLQAILLLAYIPVYASLNWRTCAELGYCGSITSVVLMTIATLKVRLFLGVAICSLAAFMVERSGSPDASNEKRKY